MDYSVAEFARQESSHDSGLVPHSGCRYATVYPQKLSILLKHQILRAETCGSRWGNDALILELSQKPAQSGTTCFSPSSKLFSPDEKSACHRFVDVFERDPAPIEPLTENRNDPQLKPTIVVSITLLRKQRGESPHVGRYRPGKQSI